MKIGFYMAARSNSTVESDLAATDPYKARNMIRKFSDSTRKFVLNQLSRHNKKSDTTAQLYCTLSTYVTQKIFTARTKKTNTTPQLYGTLNTSTGFSQNVGAPTVVQPKFLSPFPKYEIYNLPIQLDGLAVNFPPEGYFGFRLFSQAELLVPIPSQVHFLSWIEPLACQDASSVQAR